MYRGSFILIATILSLTAAVAWAQPPSLEVAGRVVQEKAIGQADPVLGRMIWLRGMQRFVFTGADGLFTLKLTEPHYRPGEEVEVIVNLPGWQIFDPVGGRIAIPAQPGAKPLLFRMAPVGQPVFLSDAAVSLFLHTAVDDGQPAIKAQGSSQPAAIERAMAKWAEQYGLSLPLVRLALVAWLEKRKNDQFGQPDERCLLRFVQGEIAESATCFENQGRPNRLADEPTPAVAVQDAERLMRNYMHAARLYSALQDSAGAERAIDKAVRSVPRGVAPQLWVLLRTEQARHQRWLARDADAPKARLHLGQAIAAYRDTLGFYAQASRPVQWAELQRHLGQALRIQAALLPPQDRAAALLNAVEAMQQSLLVYTRERYPTEWAGLQFSLGLTRTQQAEQAEAPQRETLLQGARENMQAAMTVFTRQQSPEQFAEIMLAMAGTCHALGDRACAEEAAVTAYWTSPTNTWVYGQTTALLQEKLLASVRALPIHRDHAVRHPEEVGVQTNLAEALLQNGYFVEAQQQITRISPRAKASDQVALLYLQALLYVAEEQRAPPATMLRRIRDLIAAQPADFRLNWTFDSTEHFIRTDKRMQVARTQLLALTEALNGKPRDSVLAGLDALQADK